MWFRSMVGSSKSSAASEPSRPKRRNQRPRRAAERLRLESLEDRCLLTFIAPVDYAAGVAPDAVVAADFNADGRPDLAVANSGSNSVSVLLGNADGTFRAAQSSATDTYPKSLAVGDFNADGKLDLATANSGDVSVLLGNGNGTFQAPSNIYIGSAPASVAVGDFNADGKLDLGVTSNRSGGGYGYSYVQGLACVLLGNGAGSFALTNITALGPANFENTGSEFAAAGDFNGDGQDDFAAVETTLFGSDGVVLLLGNPDGSLTPSAYSSVPQYPSGLTAGDANGDGRLDVTLSYADSVFVVPSDGLVVVPGDGLGAFGAPQTYATGASPHAAALADFNGDGKTDLITPNSGDNTVSVLLGNGNGAFRPPINAVTSAGPIGIAVGDFNGDGRPDVASASSSSNNVSVLLNDGVWPAPAPPPSSFSVSGFPASTQAGTPGSFSVTALNADGTANTGYTGTVRFSSSDGQAALPAAYTFTAADAGTHAFSATLKTAGTQSLTATDTTGAVTTSEAGIAVTPAAASHFAVRASESSTAGSALSVTVTALDSYNNTAGGYAGTIHFTSSDSQASLPGDYAFTAADAGVHTFTSAVTLKTAGSQTVTASDTITGAINGGATVAVNGAAASSMTVAGLPSPIIAGVAGSLTVTLKDAYGNVATGYTGTVHFTSSDGKAVLPANYTFTSADAGKHTFSATLKTAGTQSISATDTVNAGLHASDGSIKVKPAAASKFVLTAPSTVMPGVPFSLTITVEDAYGNIVTGYVGTVHFSSSDLRAKLPANYTFTAGDNGGHTFTGLVLRKGGYQTITVIDTHNSAITGKKVVDVV